MLSWLSWRWSFWLFWRSRKLYEADFDVNRSRMSAAVLVEAHGRTSPFAEGTAYKPIQGGMSCFDSFWISVDLPIFSFACIILECGFQDHYPPCQVQRVLQRALSGTGEQFFKIWSTEMSQCRLSFKSTSADIQMAGPQKARQLIFSKGTQTCAWSAALDMHLTEGLQIVNLECSL